MSVTPSSGSPKSLCQLRSHPGEREPFEPERLIHVEETQHRGAAYGRHRPTTPMTGTVNARSATRMNGASNIGRSVAADHQHPLAGDLIEMHWDTVERAQAIFSNDVVQRAMKDGPGVHQHHRGREIEHQ